MVDKDIEYAMDGIERLYPSSFNDFFDRRTDESYRVSQVENARRAVHAIETGFENASRYADADEIMEAAETDGSGLKTVLNMFGRAEILPTWNSSAPFTFYTDGFDPQPLEDAFEYITGEEYSDPVIDSPRLSEEDSEILEKLGSSVDEALEGRS
ncbi:MAG: hypothetical protein ABEJ99_04465 [Candidatus Nanohaloarchaea archaeon]